MTVEHVKCPTCEGPMTRRVNAATGQRFWGCNRYPVCTGTRDTDGEARQPRLREALDVDDELPSERQRRNDQRRWRYS